MHRWRAVNRFAEVDLAAGMECRRAEHGNADGQQPHPHAVPVFHIDDVGNGTQRAEMRFLAKGANDKCDGKNQPDGQLCRLRNVAHRGR